MGDTTRYHLKWPEAGDIADVPTDMMELAQGAETAIDTKLQRADYTPPSPPGAPTVPGADTIYQKKITVATTLPATPSEGDIVFLVTS